MKTSHQLLDEAEQAKQAEYEVNKARSLDLHRAEQSQRHTIGQWLQLHSMVNTVNGKTMKSAMASATRLG